MVTLEEIAQQSSTLTLEEKRTLATILWAQVNLLFESASNVKEKFGTNFQIARDTSGGFRWWLVASNGQVLAKSPISYPSQDECFEAISLFKQSPIVCDESISLEKKDAERPDMERKLEREWLKQNWREYLGQWVAIEGNKLISCSEDAKNVFAEARAAGIRVPFVIHVQDPTLPQMGGW